MPIAKLNYEKTQRSTVDDYPVDCDRFRVDDLSDPL